MALSSPYLPVRFPFAARSEKDEMSIETGLFVMAGAFVVVWLVFVTYNELSIARSKRDDPEEGGDARA
jgi:hypothetical protein